MPRLNVDRRRSGRLPAIVGVGVDCEEISRFKKMGSGAMEKIFTEREREYCKSKADPSQHFAARFAGKEAVMKCMSPAKIPFDRIEIAGAGKGRPEVKVLDERFKYYDFEISLSHSGNMAIAFAIAFRSKSIRKG